MKKLKVFFIPMLILIVTVFCFLNYVPSPSVAIFAVYHKPAFLLKNDIVIPIQGGRSLEQEALKTGLLSQNNIHWLHKNMIGDNVGENISDKNRRYSELSAVYWVYKNYMTQKNAPRYIGLVHYRRQFLLNSPLPKWKYKHPYYVVSRPNWNHLEEIGFTKENLEKILSEYDIIVHRVKIPLKIKYMEYDYRGRQPFKQEEVLNYQKVMDIVLKHYPEMAEDVASFGEGNKEVFANMFIMPKKEFMKYAEFMFTVLNEIDEGLDYTKVNPRIVGVWGEQLTSFGIYHLEKKGLKIKESNAVFIGDPNSFAELPLI